MVLNFKLNKSGILKIYLKTYKVWNQPVLFVW